LIHNNIPTHQHQKISRRIFLNNPYVSLYSFSGNFKELFFPNFEKRKKGRRFFRKKLWEKFGGMVKKKEGAYAPVGIPPVSYLSSLFSNNFFIFNFEIFLDFFYLLKKVYTCSV